MKMHDFSAAPCRGRSLPTFAATIPGIAKFNVPSPVACNN
jgi:hypothetical protein